MARAAEQGNNYTEEDYCMLTPFETAAYTFEDRIKANIFDDLWIDFHHMSQITGI